jgi:hypothetical protein
MKTVNSFIKRQLKINWKLVRRPECDQKKNRCWNIYHRYDDRNLGLIWHDEFFVAD